MNKINSVCIEGSLSAEPVLSENSNKITFCTFPLSYKRIYIENETTKETTSTFQIKACSRLAIRIYNDLHTGDNVRVIGKLEEERLSIDSSVIKVIADHVEIK